MTLVSANIRFVPIVEGVHWREDDKRQSGNRKHGFCQGFRRYIFTTLRNETNVIVYYYLIPCRLSSHPKMTLADSEWLECSLYVTVTICDLAFSNFLLTYLL